MLSGTTLKDMGEGKSSQWVELWTVHMVLHFVWKKKMARCEIAQLMWESPLYAVNMFHYHWLTKKLFWPVAGQTRDRQKS